ncbi:MAG: regulatory protein GemA [Alphaproteobacteria bacterium]|nr:regulatory protein GemA [Alphaproteobacteria bacterium]
MSAAPERQTDPYRRQLLGKVHIAKKTLGLDDDTYRDLLEAHTGKRSASKCSNAQLVDLVEHFKTQGFKPKRKAPARAGRSNLADGESQRKVRALWLSLYHLGLVQESSEPALAAFVKRQAGVEDLRFLTPSKSYKVIEALKSWASRPVDKGGAGVRWDAYASDSGPFYKPRCRVMEAQWLILHDLGVVQIRDASALASWVGRFINSPRSLYHTQISDKDADRVIEALGREIRKAKAEADR